jgi:hypothetical protein
MPHKGGSASVTIWLDMVHEMGEVRKADADVRDTEVPFLSLLNNNNTLGHPMF